MRVREFEAMIERRSGFCFLYLAAHGEKGKACDNCPLHKNGACSVYYEDNSLFTQVRNARAKMERLTKQLWQKIEKAIENPTK